MQDPKNSRGVHKIGGGFDNSKEQANPSNWLQRHTNGFDKLLQRRVPDLQRQQQTQHNSPELQLYPCGVQLYHGGRDRKYSWVYTVYHAVALHLVCQGY